RADDHPVRRARQSRLAPARGPLHGDVLRERRGLRALRPGDGRSHAPRGRRRAAEPGTGQLTLGGAAAPGAPGPVGLPHTSPVPRSSEYNLVPDRRVGDQVVLTRRKLAGKESAVQAGFVVRTTTIAPVG